MRKPEFHHYVCDGDTISWTQDGFEITARIEHDDDMRKPDERDCGFWPSLDPESAGYIGPKSRDTLARYTKRAKEVMELWLCDGWWYVGVCVTVSFDDVVLTGEYDHACWGIECNYPVKGKRNPNAYLTEVARELAGEAIKNAKEKLTKLKEKV